jgi:hypothetical protein
MLSLLDPAVRSALETTGVACEVVACDPALADTAGFVQAYGYALEDSANTIVVTGKSAPPRYAACVVLAKTRLDVNPIWVDARVMTRERIRGSCSRCPTSKSSRVSPPRLPANAYSAVRCSAARLAIDASRETAER